MAIPDRADGGRPSGGEADERPRGPVAAGGAEGRKPIDRAVTATGVAVGLINLGFTLWDRLGGIFRA
ncbi:hypothetical protein [Kitasatospora purpeofusca]|uniref:hypothetical protein n=1 Tax=Kitasatospora purpeofusca TaxID=67352 RepID=UPI0036D3E382